MSQSTLGLVAYSVAGVLMLALCLATLLAIRRGVRGWALVLATLVSALWAFAMAYGSYGVDVSPMQVFAVEMSFDAAWLYFLGALFEGAASDTRVKWIRFGGLALVAALVGCAFLVEVAFASRETVYDAGSVLVIGSILTSLFVLSAVEQIYRNARTNQKPALKFVCLGIGSVFAFDLLLYTNAVLAGHLSLPLWETRGVIVSMCVILLFVATRRSQAWTSGLFVSRRMVFYTATIFGTGVYLTAVGLLGYFLKTLGGDWGEAAQLALFTIGGVSLFVLLISDRLRRKLQVFIDKNFYDDRYDYREEWLRLIRSLTEVDDPLPLGKRAIRALARIVGSGSGCLWLTSGPEATYVCTEGWNEAPPGHTYPADHPLPQFLQATGWIVDARELRGEPGRYRGLSSDDLEQLGSAAFVLPLLHDRRLVGFVTLSEPAGAFALNYEARDLLKTAGLQIASHVAQEMATSELSEHKQFETFNRLTAFLMHDLNNLIAQQSLIVENADRHKSNPDFIDDAIGTIKSGVSRMRRVVDQLRYRDDEERLEKVDVHKLLLRVISQCENAAPVPSLHVGEGTARVRANQQRLEMALLHAIRNAQDAIEDGEGSITVTMQSDESECEIEISDTGCGMDEAFIRDRLFKPFDSTKGATGMGIGAYQIRETIAHMGGRLAVSSAPGHGTTLTFHLPSSSANGV